MGRNTGHNTGRRLAIVVAAAVMGLAGMPAWAAAPAAHVRTERFTWQYHGTEIDMPGMGGLGLGCWRGSDCFTLRVGRGEHSLTLDVRSLTIPVFAIYSLEDDGSRGWASPGGATEFCGRTAIPNLEPGDPVTVYFTAVQNPFPVLFGQACPQSTTGQLTATFR